MAVYPMAETGAFLQAEKHFRRLVTELRGDDAVLLTEDEVERLIDTQGTEVLRKLLQGYLDHRSVREARVPVVGADDVVRTHRRDRVRPLETLFGRVEVQRQAWSTRDFGALHPLDAQLNLPVQLYSFELQRRVCEFALGSSFDRTVDLVVSTSGGTVPKRQSEETVVNATVDFDAFYENKAPVVAAADDLVVLSFDGKGIVMRHDSLRPATKKAAMASEPKLQTRLSKGEKPNRKRMAMVAVVYLLAAVPRLAEDLLHGEKDGERSPGPRPTDKRVWASIVHEAETVIDHAFQEALARDPERKRSWVVLVDGNKSQIRLVKKMARRYRVKITLILDIVHVIEYLWKAAWCFHNEGDPDAETWVQQRLAAILAGRSSGVAGGVRRSATLRKLTPKQRKPIDVAARYLVGHREMLRYDEFLPRGFPVATGVVEGACRHLIADRLDITGARWGLERAEAILRLRALYASGDLDAYWDFHTQREFVRNHLEHYADPNLVSTDLREAA